MKNVGSGFSSVAVMLLVVSSALPLAQQTNANSHRDVVQKHEAATMWHVRSNGCALGNDPPPGANCSR